MEDLATRCLKYGDVFYLKVDGKQSFVSAHDRATPQVRTEELSDAAESPPDLKDCLFEVTKKYQYTQQSSLTFELTKYGLAPEEVLASESTSTFEEHLSRVVKSPKGRQRMVSLFNAFIREKRTNDNEFKQVVGESVLYGQVVQLRHISTGKFVTIKRTAADVERGALKVVLDESGQEGSWFQVFSGYRTKPEGAKLMPGEVVTLKGLAFSGNGLHISVGDITEPTMLPIDRHPYVTSAKEVCASPEVSPLKVIPFSVHEKVFPALKERICGMSSVSIQDLVANTVYINMLGALNEKYLYFESPLTRPDPNRVSGPDSWRLEMVTENGFWCGMPLTHGSQVRIRHLPTGCYLAAISQRAKDAARTVRQEKAGAVWLRNGGAAGTQDITLPPTPAGGEVAVGGAVGSIPAPDDDVLYDEAFRLVLTKRYNVPDTLWELNCFSKEDVVGNKCYAFFRHIATQFWLSGAGPPIPQQRSGEPDGPRDPDDPQEEQVYPVVHPEKLERNVMLVIKLPLEFTSKVLNLQRVLVQLREVRHVLHKEKIPPEAELLELVDTGKEDQAVELLAKTQYPDKFRQRYPALKRSLKDLAQWLDKNTWSDATDAASPHIEYQSLVRELGIIDLIVQYMDVARVRLFAAAPKLRQTKTGHSVVESGKLCHKILQLACQGNENNQAYLSKYAGMVMSHLSWPLTAPDTLAAMYEDNMAQMQTVSPEIVGASVQLIRDYGFKPRFINFLRQICGTSERPMPNNQNWIVAEIMGGGRSPLEVFCRAGVAKMPDQFGQERETWVIRALRKDEPGREAVVDASSFARDEEDLTKRSVKEWELSGDENEYSPRELFIYYCFGLKFIVSLCYGRNSLAREQILRASSMYGLGLEFEALLVAVTNKNLPYCMRTYMVQVIRALYVDIEPYQPLKLPRHIRMMSRKGSTQTGRRGPANNENVTQLITTLLSQLKQVVATGTERHPQLSAAKGDGMDEDATPVDDLGERTVGRNTLVLNYLRMVQAMFRLGMMELDSPTAQEMLSVLLEIIQKFDSMPLDKAERFGRRYASKVVMEAKKVALQTIDFALDMKSEVQCANIFSRFADWQRSPERSEMWARKHAHPGRMGMKSMAGLLGIRAAATLGIGNKAAPSAASPGDAQPQDPEAPPPKDDPSGETDGDGGMAIFVTKAAELLAAENEDGDFPLFKLDTLSDTEPLYRQHSSPLMKLFDLVRYEDQELTARTFQMLERLTSKREKLLEELMRTFVVTDDDLISLSTWALQQVEIAQHAYNYMGSLDPKESQEACAKATKAIENLTTLLMPLKHVILSDAEGPDRVFVSKTTAANCQYLLFDMQVHLMVLKFLKLPLKRKPNADPHRLQDADDPARREVFRACLEFLRHFMVVGDLEASNVPSHANQAAIMPCLELLLSFLDMRGLPASDTVIALFIANQADAAAEGEKVIRKLVKLIMRYGDKQHAGWLELLAKVMVVDGIPIKRNQMVALQLITQYSEEVLLLLNGDSGLEELRTLLGSERLTARPSADPPISRLSYHTACTQLLADCCCGKEPELVVKASGYMNLTQVMDVLLLQPSAEVSEANLRYVQRAYWRLLQHCYFATDTDNTRVQVRNGANRIWPLSATDDAEAGLDVGNTSLLLQRFLDIPAAGTRKTIVGFGGVSCLVQAVLEEVKRALADPSDALGNADSATFFLVTAVFPALKDYFENHWHSHVAKLNTSPTVLLSALYDHVMDLHDSLKRLKDTASSQSVKSEMKMALANTRALLAAMPPEANTDNRVVKAKTFGPGKPSAPSTSQHTTITSNSQQVVQKEWMEYLRRLAADISVEINRDTYEVVEVLHSNALFAAAASSLGMGEVTPIFEQASLLRLARMLAAKFGRRVPGTNPAMCFEKLIEMLCELLAYRNNRDKTVGPTNWKPALMVKMVRTVCAAAVLDDGAGAVDGTALRDAWASLGLLRVDDMVVDEWKKPSAELLDWRQTKYNKLGATRAAVTLLAHPMPEVQLEALKLLEVLLQGGNRTVQGTIFEILKDGSELADAVFANFKAAFSRCRKYIFTEAYLKSGKTRAAKKKLMAAEAAKKALMAAVNVLGNAGTMVVGVAGAAGKQVVGAAGAAGKQVAGAAGNVGGKVAKSLGNAGQSESSIRSRFFKRKRSTSGAKVAPAPAVDAQQPSLPPPPLPPPPPPPQEVATPPRATSGSGGAALKAVPEVAMMNPGVAAARAASTRSLGAAREGSSSVKRRDSSAGPSRRGSDDNASTAPAVGADGPTVESVVEEAVLERGTPDIAVESYNSGPRPVAENTEPSDVGGEGQEEDEDEVRWEDKVAKLNNADNAYEFNKVLLAVLKSMVEGHYKHLQTLLQVQPNSTASLDLVVEAVELLNVLQDHVPTSLRNFKHEVADLMVLVCNFVQEMVQGPCSSNQDSLAGTNFLASCNRVFGCIEYSEKHNPIPDDVTGKDRGNQLRKCRIKTALLNLLTSLLEACHSADIPSRCYDILDFDVIDRQIARLCKVLGMTGEDPRYPPNGDDVAECDDEVLCNLSAKLEDELLLMCSYVLKLSTVTPMKPPPLPYIIALFNGEDVEKMDDLTPDQALYAGELQAFLQRRLGYVEINWKNTLIEPCFFNLTPECSNLVTSTVWCENTLDRINNTVSPDSRAFPTVKAAELVEVLEDVVDDITLDAKLTRTKWLKVVSAIGRYRMRLLELTFYLAVATLIFQALADARWDPHTPFSERGEDWKTIVLTVAVGAQTICTFLLYTSFVYTDLNKYMSHQVPKTIAALHELGNSLRFGSKPEDENALALDNEEGAEGAAEALALGLSRPPLDKRRGWLDFLTTTLAFLLSIASYPKFWYFDMLVGASLAGLFVSPFFLVFHFTIYFLDFDSGKQLVMAIQRSGINILNTFVLAVLAIYTFAVVTFLVFKEPTDVDKGDGPPCDTFYQCMGAHMLTGIMGDISNLFNSDLWDTVPETVNSDGLQQARTIFVLAFFMLWNFVLSNIFVGLIASAFEAIRDDQNTITSDRLSKCLICSQDMYLFNEKIQGGFDEHIQKQHNALQYVFFLHHLRATTLEDFTGAETVVSHVLDNAKTTTDKGTWLPVSKSLAVMHAMAAATSSANKDAGAGGQ